MTMIIRFLTVLFVAALCGLMTFGPAWADPSLKPKPGPAAIPNPTALVCCLTPDRKAVQMSPQKCRLIRGRQTHPRQCQQVCCVIGNRRPFLTARYQCLSVNRRGRVADASKCRFPMLPGPRGSASGSNLAGPPNLICCRTRDQKTIFMTLQKCQKAGGTKMPIVWCRSDSICCKVRGRRAFIESRRQCQIRGGLIIDPGWCR